MLVKDFITKELPVLKSFDTGEYALALMDDFKLKHLPLLSENIYRCLVSEKDLLAMPDPTAIIGDPVLFSPSVQEDTTGHPLSVEPPSGRKYGGRISRGHYAR